MPLSLPARTPMPASSYLLTAAARARRRCIPAALFLLAACKSSIPVAPPMAAATAAGAYFDEVWTQYDARYPFFEFGRIDWRPRERHIATAWHASPMSGWSLA